MGDYKHVVFAAFLVMMVMLFCVGWYWKRAEGPGGKGTKEKAAPRKEGTARGKRPRPTVTKT
jgi:hypothetical protein